MVNVREDLTDQVIDRLTVLGRAPDYIDPSGKARPRWWCQCSCGSDPIAVQQSKLKDKKHGQKSCGCIGREKTAERNRQNAQHGMSHTRLYKIWKGRHTRCYNKNDEHYPDYGERGITICDEWIDDYNTFYQWAIKTGYNDTLTIDRINVNGNYESDNCRWITVQQQQNNRRNNVILTYNGESHTIKEWADILGIEKHSKLYWRYHQGWSVEDILTK